MQDATKGSESQEMYSLFKAFLKKEIEVQVNQLPKVHKNVKIEVAAIFLAYDNE